MTAQLKLTSKLCVRLVMFWRVYLSAQWEKLNQLLFFCCIFGVMLGCMMFKNTQFKNTWPCGNRCIIKQTWSDHKDVGHTSSVADTNQKWAKNKAIITKSIGSDSCFTIKKSTFDKFWWFLYLHSGSLINKDFFFNQLLIFVINRLLHH